MLDVNVVIVLLEQILLGLKLSPRFADLSSHIMRLAPFMVEICMQVRLAVGKLELISGRVLVWAPRLGPYKRVFVELYLVILELHHLLHVFKLPQIV